MQLSYSSASLRKTLRLFGGLFLLFTAGTIYAALSDSASDPRRTLALIVFPVGASISGWVAATTIGLMVSKPPAAVIETYGIRINGIAGRKKLRWDDLTHVGIATMSACKTLLETIEFRRGGKYPIRLPTSSLSDNRSDIVAWVNAAKSKLHAHAA